MQRDMLTGWLSMMRPSIADSLTTDIPKLPAEGLTIM